jgi:hypothetical protein
MVKAIFLALLLLGALATEDVEAAREDEDSKEVDDSTTEEKEEEVPALIDGFTQEQIDQLEKDGEVHEF